MAVASTGVSRQPRTRQALFADDALQDAFALQAWMLLDRQKDHSYAIAPAVRQGKAELLTFAREELVRNLDEDARAVARFRIASAGAAMGQVEQDLNALFDDVVTFLPEMLATKPMPQASCSCDGW